jgi:integrase/recombinase XerD
VPQGKQAKTLTPAQVGRVLNEVKLSRYPERDRVIVLLSFNVGLRVGEISAVTWGMVLDAEGNVSDTLELRDGATKGKKGGRQVALCSELRSALNALKGDDRPDADARIIHSERDMGMSLGALKVWFHRLYARLGLKGASSHSGRRTFITEAARAIVSHGGSSADFFDPDRGADLIGGRGGSRGWGTPCIRWRGMSESHGLVQKIL